MDAYDISDKIKKYWMALYPKNSGEMPKPKVDIKVIVNTTEGYREVTGVYINEDKIELILDKE
jgi:hypothetical protein